MPLEVQPLTEADAPAFVAIQYAAFRSAFARHAFPLTRGQEQIDQDVEKHRKSMREDADVHFLKVVDTDLDNKIIACAKWRINEEERTQEEFEKSLGSVQDDWTPVLKEFYGWLTEMRKKWMGTKPFYCGFACMLRRFERAADS
jgi:hypothetical protein